MLLESIMLLAKPNPKSYGKIRRQILSRAKT
jgi:hypothetical protein